MEGLWLARPQNATKRRKKKKNNYFTQDTEDAILKFQQENDAKERQKIFMDAIHPAFYKLIENLIFVYRFHNIGNLETLKVDCLSFLFESLHKFDATRGHKAFSYFNVIARNWLIQRRKIYLKKSNSDVHLDSTVITDLEKEHNESVVVSYETDLLDEEFIHVLREELRDWRNKFEKSAEKTVLEAVIVLLDSPDLIPLYNKKAIYTYLRDITGMNTKQVVTNLGKIRKKYQLLRKKYMAGEY